MQRHQEECLHCELYTVICTNDCRLTAPNESRLIKMDYGPNESIHFRPGSGPLSSARAGLLSASAFCVPLNLSLSTSVAKLHHKLP